MSDLMQAHERLAALLMRNSGDAVIAVADSEVLYSNLVELSHASSMGSSCIYLSEEINQVFERMVEKLSWLSLSSEACLKSAVILLQENRLYLNKYFHAERDIEASLKVLVDQKAVFDEAATVAKITPLKYMSEAGKQVILNTLRQNLSVITGGPGTGKTTIVVRVLALLIEFYHQQGNDKVSIEILAPTGKASARVKESIVSQKNEWLEDLQGFDRSIVEAIPESSQTVQKFLGINPTTRKSRFKRGQKANVDILIVDEASMLDVMLVKELLGAISPTTRLILLGDPYQLASVEAGNVLAQIVTAASMSENAWLAQACTELTESHRFTSYSGIGKLAAAANAGQIVSVMELLNDVAIEDVSMDAVDQSMVKAIAGYQHYKSVIKAVNDLDHKSILSVFEAFDQWQVFSPFSSGKYGVEGINLAVEEALALGTADEWYVGKPIMVTANDHALKLYNGDIGICLDKEGKTVCFPGTEADENGVLNYRFINTRILPEHQLVFAMTVHKSQGSEYERCMLVVPEPSENQRNLLTREILYTAITRAKKAFMLFAEDAEIECLVLNKTERMSGLLKG
ncbi:MAG: exodeoxyribonuclease V alpha subunit [Oleiphilaceae bacterium]|jgi:exodeoxyribonuclease V alpha subunit